jgi:glycosyltransferase 2 family protein
MTMASPSRMRTAVIIVGAMILGLGLVAGLLRITGFDPRILGERIGQLRYGFLGLVLLSSFFHFWLTSKKWRIVTETVKPGADLGHGFFLYSALIALFAQFLPMQFSMITVRTFALRLHEDVSVSKGAASTIYDQLFDFLIPAVLLIPAMLALTGMVDLNTGLILSAVALVVVGALVVGLGERFGPLIVRTLASLPGVRTLLAKRMGDADLTGDFSAFHRSTIGQLYFWSAVRYANLLFRSYCIVLAAGLDIGFAPIAYANTVVILSIVVSVTPASLGIAEWGWVGVLAAFGIQSELATEFALLNRLVILAAVVTANVLIGLGYMVSRASRSSK